MSTLKALWNKIRSWFGWSPSPPVDPTPVDPAPGPVDPVDESGKLFWAYGGFNGGGAALDPSVVLTSVSVRAGNPPVLSYTGRGLTVWPVGSQGSNINAVACIFLEQPGGRWVGGKFDWARSNAADRPMQHINGGYSNWPSGYPARGTRYAYGLWTANRKQRSNLITGVWPVLLVVLSAVGLLSITGCASGGSGSAGNPRADIEDIPAADYPAALFVPAWDGSGGAQ